MLKNSVKKLILIALCAILVMPFVSLTKSNAYAAEEYKKAFVGVDYEYTVVDETIKSSSSDKIKVIAKKEGAEAVTIYDGAQKDVEGYVAKYNAGVLTVVIYNTGKYEVTVSTIGEGSKSETFYLEIGNTVDYLTLNYCEFTSYEDEKITKFQEQIDKVASGSIIAGQDSFTIPTDAIKTLIESNVPYNKIRKTVYYYKKGDTSPSTNYATQTSLSFSISEYGDYRFYILFSIEKNSMNKVESVSITNNGMKEFEDGFYSFTKKDGGEKVYYDSVTSKFYKNEDYTGDTYEESALNKKLEIPVFKFTLVNQGPTVKNNKTSQEKGYVDGKYKGFSVTVSGNIVSKSYTLEYSETADGTFTKATEEFNESDLTFTPTKIGYYRLVVSAMDEENKTKTITTQNVVVLEKFIEVPYKVSFGDWLKANTLPFILLCVSGTCLIAILLLLFVKPKKETIEEGEGEDK